MGEHPPALRPDLLTAEEKPPPAWPTTFAKQVIRAGSGDYGPYTSSVVALARAFLEMESRHTVSETALLNRVRFLQAELEAARTPVVEPAPEDNPFAALERRVEALESLIAGTENHSAAPMSTSQRS